MNRWIQRVVTFASITSALALVPAGVAFAQTPDTQGQAHPGKHHGMHGKHGKHGKKGGLVGAALKLDSLSPEQRAQIEQLEQSRKVAAVPVRQADAQLLTVLAQQVEAGTADPQAQAQSLAVERAAAMNERVVDQTTLNQLHAILTPAQRNQLVDRIESHAGRAQPGAGQVGPAQANEFAGKAKRFAGAGFGGARLGLSPEQKAQVKANLGQTGGGERRFEQRGAEMRAALESFRGDSFNAGAMVRPMVKGEREAKLANAMIPVLTPNQRATFATQLRNRAAHEGRS